MRRKIEMVAVTDEEILWAGGDGEGAGGVVLLRAGVEIEGLLERLVALTEDLLADVREVADLPERTGYVCLSAGDEDASCDDGFERFSAKELLLVRTLIELLGNIGDGLRKGELIAPGGNVAEGGEEVAL